MIDDGPRFGYGAGRRPLWTVRDRDTEVIRTVLRKAGRRESGERHGGFVVEGGEAEASFAVACADDAQVSAQELSRYEQALHAAGYRVELDPDDDQALRVWPIA